MTVKVVSIMSAETTFPLLADVQYMEPYGSAAFNRKLKNIIRPGFFEGFTPVPGNGLELIIRSDNSGGAASVDVNGLQITVQQNSDVSLLLPPGSTSIIVLEANYVHGVKTTQVDSSSSVPATQIIALTDDKLASNQIEVCRVNIPAGAQQIDESMIDQSHRVNRGIGIQLSSEIDSDRDDIAASSNAVKKLHEMILGIDFPDGSTEQPGLVQLSSATDSDAEDRAATPKAVKVANDNANERVPSERKVNGRELTADISVTAQDIFNGQTVGLGSAVDLNSVTTPGLYYQPANAQAESGMNYPEANAGSLEVYKHAGVTQIYRVYNNSRSYIRTLFDSVWSAWAKQYDASNKPTPADIGALPLGGGRLTGTLEIYNGAPIIQLSESDTGKNYFIVADGSGFRINEDSTAGNALLSYAGASKKLVTVGQIAPGDWTNIDARYYTKAQSDAAYMPRTGAYTKAESDARYQLTSSADTHGISGKILWSKNGKTGVIRMTGITDNVTNSGRVAFPFAFPTKCYSVVANRHNSDGHSAAMQPYDISTSGWYLRIAGGGTESISWTAEGI
jgi:hypothetical protein